MKTNTVDEKVKVEEGKSHHEKGSLVYTHPSYGMVSISRGTCSGEGEHLFGAKHPSSSVISLTISKASNTQNLGSNWYYDYETVTKVQMTPVQYAELISNPNTQGVPCTIRYNDSEGHIKYRPHPTELDYIETKIKSGLDELDSKLETKKSRAKEILSRKGSLKKVDKEELLKILINMDSEIQSNIPFYKEQMKKSLDKMVMEANSDIESLVSSVQTKLGKAVLDKPETLRLLLSDKK
jgi:hypothetical protein